MTRIAAWMQRIQPLASHHDKRIETKWDKADSRDHGMFKMPDGGKIRVLPCVNGNENAAFRWLDADGLAKPGIHE